MIKKSGLSIFKEIEFPDHYSYSEKDINDILVEAQKFDCKIITTEKDFLRLDNPKLTEIKFIKTDLKIIDEENIRIINDFIKVQDGNFFQRFFYFFKSGIYRQSILGNIAIFIFSLLKKI